MGLLSDCRQHRTKGRLFGNNLFSHHTSKRRTLYFYERLQNKSETIGKQFPFTNEILQEEYPNIINPGSQPEFTVQPKVLN